MVDTIIIAGKNNIAIEVASFLKRDFPSIDLIAVYNKTDNGTNSFQRSFRNYCEVNGIRSVTLEESYNFKNAIFLSLEYDRIVNPAKFSSSSLYNIHFSYLPSYKGMYTSALPIIFNEKYSGVTLHEIDSGIDTGDIVDQIKFEIGEQTTGQELYLKYIAYGTALVKKNLPDLIEGKIMTKPQDSLNASYYSKKEIDYSNLKIDYNKTAREIYNQIRAFSFPAYQLPKFKDYTIYHSEVTSEKSIGKSGQIVSKTDFTILLSTIDYNILLFLDKRQELFDACKKGDISYIKFLASHNYPLNQRSIEGWDALIIAAYNGHFEIVKLLIEKFNWDYSTTNNNGTTFLMYVMTHASKSNDQTILKYVLDNFQDIDLKKKDYYGYDIKYYARQLNNPQVLKLL